MSRRAPEGEGFVLTEEQIARRVRELGAVLSRDYKGRTPHLVGVLKGAFMFMADLVRQISIPMSLDFIAVSSYGSSTRSTGVVRIIKDLDESVEGRHVIIVEDIVDTGLTLRYLREIISDRAPASVKVCALLDKPAKRCVDVEPDYVGFTIPGEYVIGYGLDHAQMYRNLPYIRSMSDRDASAQGSGRGGDGPASNESEGDG